MLLTLSAYGYAEIKNLHINGFNVTFQARDEKLGELLKILSESFSFKYSIPPALAEKTVTTNINNKPVDKALSRILSLVNETNYTIVFTGDGKITKLKIYKKNLRKPKKAVATRKKYNRNIYRRRPLGRVINPPPIYSQPPAGYEDEIIEDEDLYYPERNYERNYSPNRRLPYLPSNELY